jgi:hypothetical protein
MLRTMHWTGFVMVTSLLTGCAHLYDCADECIMEWKCCHAAKMAWHHSRDLYANVASPYDFGQGFREGYQSICMGGDGCRPAMPPRHYWSHHYQCDEGKLQIMAWYDGYHHGVLAAQCDGCEGRCQVLCAADLYGQADCEMDYSDVHRRVAPEEGVPPHGHSDYGHELPGYGPAEMKYHHAPLAPPPAPAAAEHGVPMMPSAASGGDRVGLSPAPGLERTSGVHTGPPSPPSF